MYPLQTLLQSVLLQSRVITTNTDPTILQFVSERGMQGAQIVLTTLPILLVYPLLQRYFVSGLTLGAVKG
jgi:putative aldouronate transport system permease protein